MLSSQIHLFNLFCFKNGKYIEKVHATELQSYLWQFEQIPLTTMLIFSRVKWVGRFTDGTGMSLRQYVCLHFSSLFYLLVGIWRKLGKWRKAPPQPR